MPGTWVVIVFSGEHDVLLLHLQMDDVFLLLFAHVFGFHSPLVLAMSLEASGAD